MPNSQINLSNTFKAIFAAKDATDVAKKAAKATGWDGACAVAMYFAGSPLPDNAKATIMKAWKDGTGKDMAGQMAANYLTFARAGAAGTFDQWKTAWERWTDFCGAVEPKAQPTGDAFNVVRDVLNHNANPNRKGDAFEASAKGIGEFRQYKANKRNDPDQLVERLNDLADDVADSVPEIGDSVRQSMLSIIKLVKEARPDDFVVTKTATKRKIIKLPVGDAQPAPVVTPPASQPVVTPPTPPASNVVDMAALLGMIQQQQGQIAALITKKSPKK